MLLYKGVNYGIIKRFDGQILEVGQTTGHGLFTSFPISSKAFRDEHPTGAKVIVVRTDSRTHFNIVDDLGVRHVVTLNNRHRTTIESAIERCRAEGLLSDDDLHDERTLKRRMTMDDPEFGTSRTIETWSVMFSENAIVRFIRPRAVEFWMKKLYRIAMKFGYECRHATYPSSEPNINHVVLMCPGKWTLTLEKHTFAALTYYALVLNIDDITMRFSSDEEFLEFVQHLNVR